MKTDDPSVTSYTFIENPFSNDDELLDFLQTEDDDESGNNAVREQLRLEEQFGSFSNINREQTLFLLKSYTNHPKELTLLASPTPDIVMEDIPDDIKHPISYPPPLVRSSLYIPVIDVTSNHSKLILDDESILSYKNNAWINTQLQDYTVVNHNIHVDTELS